MKKPYQLRLEEEMIDQVKDLAIISDRSTNAEFRHLIKKSLTNVSDSNLTEVPCPELKKFANREKIPCETKQQLIELAFKISENALTYLEQDTIDNVLNINLR